jgi:GH35 family endo-1,4-beta-xylanase
MWDVVNEAVHLGKANLQTRMSQYARVRGAVPYVLEHLDAARQADPGALLLVNDYRLEPRYYEILDQLREPGGRLLFDVVGLQSHMHSNLWPLKKIWDTCDNYAHLGLPLHFTETTVVSGPRLEGSRQWGATNAELERRQADYVERFYTMVYGHPNVAALTWWDFSDNGAWQRAAAGFLRQDMSPKPAYDRLLQLIRGEWWTNRSGKTDSEGLFATRVAYGTHRIRVKTDSGKPVERTVSCHEGQPNRAEIVVG